MRFIINGRKYRLRDSIVTLIQGVGLIVLGIVCHKIQADGAAVFVWLVGTLLAISAIGNSKCKGIVYHIAKAYIAEKEAQ